MCWQSPKGFMWLAFVNLGTTSLGNTLPESTLLTLPCSSAHSSLTQVSQVRQNGVMSWDNLHGRVSMVWSWNIISEMSILHFICFLSRLILRQSFSLNLPKCWEYRYEPAQQLPCSVKPKLWFLQYQTWGTWWYLVFSVQPGLQPVKSVPPSQLVSLHKHGYPGAH